MEPKRRSMSAIVLDRVLACASRG